MTNDIEVSSIGHNYNKIEKTSNKNTIKTIDKKEKNNIFFGEEEEKFIKGNKKDSIISILNEL